MVTLSIAEIILEYACPAAGMVCANWMFLAPLSDVRDAARTGTLGDLNPLPWAVMWGNTVGWVSYGLLRSNWFIFFGNAPGFLLSCFFNLTAVKLLYAASVSSIPEAPTTTALLHSHNPDDDVEQEAVQDRALRYENGADANTTMNDKQEETTVSRDSPTPSSVALTEPSSTNLVSTSLVAAPPEKSQDTVAAVDATLTATNTAGQQLQNHERMLLVMVLVWTAVLSMLVATGDRWNDNTRQMVTGITCNANLLFFYGAPLSMIGQVLRSRSSRWLHGPTMVRNTANGAFWAAYGVAVLDPYVAVPNGLGALLGVVQMVLWIIFPRKEHAAELERTEQRGSHNKDAETEEP